MEPGSSDHGAPGLDRLKSLEEAVGFLEHTLAQQQAEVESLGRRVMEALRRLAALESAARAARAPEEGAADEA